MFEKLYSFNLALYTWIRRFLKNTTHIAIALMREIIEFPCVVINARRLKNNASEEVEEEVNRTHHFFFQQAVLTEAGFEYVTGYYDGVKPSAGENKTKPCSYT